jgi:hypothetical protein
MSRYFIAPEAAAATTPTYDYTSVYSGISTALSNIDADTTPMAATLALIATSLATLATNSTTVATNSTTIATNVATIASNSTTIRTLAEGTGIHMVSPYEWVGLMSIYRAYVEKGSLLDSADEVSAEKIAEARTKLETYFEKLSSLPTSF